MKVIEKTHNKDPTLLPPQTAICIKATNMRVREGKGTSANYIDMSSSIEVLYSAVCERCAGLKWSESLFTLSLLLLPKALLARAKVKMQTAGLLNPISPSRIVFSFAW